MKKLKGENFFKNITGEEVFLTFTVSDYEFENKEVEDIIIQLNDNDYQTEYLEWMKSWAD
ncbi:hypothetical protein [Fulvivirga maritima]|uniref:hypothetical protein n=1 Tax=Fulvivirga maritima TaxID=2904247 RepID=UPI00210299A1|nr:hypothetical protein [Fulvivirga maritima]